MNLWRKEYGLTLTEVLLGVMILAALATAAVSETIQSKTRADVARVRADMRKVAMALEAYAADQGAYPVLDAIKRAQPPVHSPYQYDRGRIVFAICLTTPVAYLDTVDVRDPFGKYYPPNPFFDVTFGGSVNLINVDFYYSVTRQVKIPPNRPSWYLLSVGPDTYQSMSLLEYDKRIDPDQTCRFLPLHYDPSNGTISYGDIIRYSYHH